MLEQFPLVRQKLLCFLEGFIELTVQNVVMNTHQDVCGARHGFLEIRDEFIIKANIFRNLSINVHELDGHVDQLGRRIRRFRAEDVLLAQDRRIPLDDEARALVTVADNCSANDNAFVGLQLNFQGHGRPPWCERTSPQRCKQLVADDLILADSCAFCN
jgi:hypothetical protein